MASRSNAPPRSNPSGGTLSLLASENTTGNGTPTTRPGPTALQQPQKKKRNHRGGKKKRTRKQSFAASTEDGSGLPGQSHRDRQESSHNMARETFYRLQGGRNHSNTSLESEALLDHRDQSSMRPRRNSTLAPPGRGFDSPASYRQSYQNPFISSENNIRRSNSSQKVDTVDDVTDERAPLLPSSARSRTSTGLVGYSGYGGSDSREEPGPASRNRRPSSMSSSKSKRRTIFDRTLDQIPAMNEEYNVNDPPSMPASPTLSTAGRDMSFGDMLTNDLNRSRSSSPQHRSENDLDDDENDYPRFERRHTIAALTASQDVCFPTEGMSEIGDDDMPPRESRNRRRRPRWPDLSVLDDWSRFEKEGRSEERRMKKITEPQLVGGRLRPIHKGWHRAEDDAPYRFTYFNEEFQSTIHSQTISELVQADGSFRELFVPDRPELSDSSDSEEDEDGFVPMTREESHTRHMPGLNGDSRAHTRQSSVADPFRPSHGDPVLADMASRGGKALSGDATPITGFKSPPTIKSPSPNGVKDGEKPKRYGDRPTWWLDVLSPTDAEMKVLSKTFGIHPLTAEDIMMQEAREKVELFRHYYFVNYRSFEQDMNNEDFLEPVNMYVVVFKEGVISFHFSMTPHPANVRRRIRQLKDYLILSSDWISYAIIDDITDVFAPLIQNIEDEVDDIDDRILKLHSSEPDDNPSGNEKKSEAGDVESGSDMLRRVGDCRKKVMGLYRLLGNKADVIKGFAKRCNEHWDVAPRSEIGLYLGDIQDHIVTMTGNLSHYEKILARSHGNYLAQINIKMNERQEQTADVLGKLTVLGTIVLPMNIITGLWGMNVWVPGQEYEGNLTWFWCLTGGLLVFGLACFFIAKLMYKIV